MPEINYEEEIASFLASHSRYIPSDRNKLLLLEFLENADLDLTAQNLDVAFLNLAAREELELKDPEEPPVVSAPRRRFQAFRNGRPL